MNKIAIPTIVLATILVAGFVAFAPVEKASAVHTTILEGTSEINTITDSDVGDAGTFDIEITGNGSDFCVISLIIETTDAQVDTTETLSLNTIEINDGAFLTEGGAALTAEAIFVPDAADDDMRVDLYSKIAGEDDSWPAHESSIICADDNDELDITLEETENGDFSDITFTVTATVISSGEDIPTINWEATPD